MEPVALPPPGVFEDVPEHDYRRWDAVNQSTLWTFRPSAAHARHTFLNRSSTPATDLGSAIHAELLEPARLEDRYIVSPTVQSAHCPLGGFCREH